jgi:secreted PhoX family phosphatase
MMHGATGTRALWAVMTAVALTFANAVASAGTVRYPGAARAGTISTVAGGIGGGLATNVAIDYPCSVTSAGQFLYVGDGLVQRVSEVTDVLTTPAGGVRRASVRHSADVPLGDGGRATWAATNACGTAIDENGNLVLADSTDSRVRVVAAASGTFYGQTMTTGDIYRVAGGGSGHGIAGNGGPAVKATLDDPVAVIVDPAGNLVIADSGSARVAAEVQVVAASSGSFYGQPMTAGDIYAIAGGKAGLLVSGDGGPATRAGLGTSIGQVQLDAAGNLVLADGSANGIRVIAEHNGTFYGQQMTAGDIYMVAGDGTRGFSGDGGPATNAELSTPAGVGVDGAGNLLIADSGNERVRMRAASSGEAYGVPVTAGHIYTIAGCGKKCPIGDGGPAVDGRLQDPDGIAIDQAGNVIVSEHGEGRISDERRVQAIAVSDGTFYGQRMTAGDIYTVAGVGWRGLSGDGGPATQAVIDSWSTRVMVDGAGNLVLPAGQNNRVRVVAATTGTFYNVPMTAHHIYTVAGGGGFYHLGCGGPALQAGINFPDGAAADPDGNLVIADQGNNSVLVLPHAAGTFYGVPMKAGHIYCVAGNGNRGYSGDGGPATKATLSMVSGLATDAAGNVVFADEGNNRVRVVAESTGTFYGVPMITGDIYTVAGSGTRGYSGDGGPATGAELNAPKDVKIDQHGNLVVADGSNDRIRVVADATGTFYGVHMTADHIYSVAGNGTRGYSGDGGPATSAALNIPTALAIGSHGNLMITDEGSNRIRMVAGKTGTFYGIPMAAGDIYTVAGNGFAGYSGDGGPAGKAMLFSPTGVAVDSQSGLYVADFYRVREIRP